MLEGTLGVSKITLLSHLLPEGEAKWAGDSGHAEKIYPWSLVEDADAVLGSSVRDC